MKKSYLTATDQFCGAGGSTTGAKRAGVEVRMALNHWRLAIETHNTNHPDTDHDCTDIQACDPRRYPSTDILITSPECTNHYLAKGQRRRAQNQIDAFNPGKVDPAAERSRATMWDVPRFSEYHDYRIVITENVVDARYWRLWDAWLKAMHDLGYDHRCLYLNSMFFEPCPQSRDRMYVVFWKKCNPVPDLDFRPLAPCPKCGTVEAAQSWKNNRRAGKYRAQYVYRCTSCYGEVVPFYYAALNAIDWAIPGKSIRDREKPLSAATMKRIAAGVQKYGNQPLILNSEYDGNGSKTHPVTMAARTQTTRHTMGLCHPFIVDLKRNGKARCIGDPVSTVVAGGNHHMLVGNYSPGWVRPATDPAGTVTCSDHHGLITSAALTAFLAYYYSGSDQTSGMTEPVGTVTTTDRASLVTGANIEDCAYRMLFPHEIQAIMAFPDDYAILGNNREKVKQLGNAVTPPVMEWIVKRCVESLS